MKLKRKKSISTETEIINTQLPPKYSDFYNFYKKSILVFKQF